MGSLYTLILTVCMIASPDGGRTPPQCKDVSVTVSMDQFAGEAEAPIMAPMDKSAPPDPRNKGGFSPYLCYRIGSLESVRYAQEHPLWRANRWRCPAPGKKFQDV